jgi:hypothetical protein
LLVFRAQCLDDSDETIRYRALDLISSMVSNENIRDVVKLLMGKVHSSEGRFMNRLAEQIIGFCSAEAYQNLRTQAR